MSDEIDSGIAEQQQIDISRKAMAEGIVEGANPQTLEEAKRLAVAWIVSAAQFSCNSDYWEKRAREAESKLSP